MPGGAWLGRSGLRPTGSGIVLAVGVVVLWIAGIGLGEQELLILATAGLVSLVLALLWVLRSPTLTVRRTIEPAHLTRGALALALVEVTNSGRFTSGAARAADRVGDDSVGVALPRLRMDQKRRATYRLPTTRRGVFTVGPLQLVRTDPLGLVRRVAPAGDTLTLWVQPAVHPAAVASLGRQRDLDGPPVDTALEGSITFQSLRTYVVGDDLRRVHWKTTARTGTLMVRQHVDTSRPQTLVLLDDRRSSYAEGADGEEALERAVEVAASIVVASRADGFPIVLELVSGATMAVAAAAEAGQLLDALAGVAAATAALPDALGAAVLRARRSGGSCVVLVSGNPGPDELASLATLRGSWDRVVALCLRRRPSDGGSGGSFSRGALLLESTDAAELVQRWSVEGAR